MSAPTSHPWIESYLDSLAPDHGRGLAVGGHLAADLAAEFGTPLYVYDADALRARYASVVGALGVDVLYSIKANPSLAVARVLRQCGAGTEVASGGELFLAEAAGFAAAATQFAGPGKSRVELRMAVERGIGSLNLESPAEYEIVAELAAELAVRPSVAVRVNPAQSIQAARLRMGGAGQKFGVDVAAVPDLLARIRAEDQVQLTGLHCYTGTQCFDAEAWLASVQEVFELAERVGPVASVNVGGGFGVPCFAGDREFDLARAGAGLTELRAGRSERVCVELGRYLTAPAGVFLCRVLYVKDSAGQRQVILDGGLHHHGAAAGLGAVLRRPYPIVAARAPNDTGMPQTIGGPLCTPADVFADAADLPELGPGDLVAVLGSGAYGLSFSPTAFTGHPAPAEVLVDGGRADLVRPRGRPQDTLRGQLLPEDV